MPAPDLARAIAALKAADAAGDADSARKLATYIRSAQGAAPAAEAAPAEPRPLEGLEAFGSGVVNVVPGAKQLVALRAAVRGGDPSLPGLQFDEGEDFASRYAKARRAIAPEQERLAEAHPGIGGAGATAGIVAQLGGPQGIVSLARAAPGMLRALVSKGLLSSQAVVGALRGAGTAAGFGVAMSDADIPLAEGNVGEAASQATAAATDPTTLALGALLGGGAGAQKVRLARQAEAAAGKAAKVQELERVQTAEAARPAAIAEEKTRVAAANATEKARVEAANATERARVAQENAAAKAQHAQRVELAKGSTTVETARREAEALAASRRVTPDNAVRVFGFDRLPGQQAGATRARAVRLMQEPVPRSTSSLSSDEMKAVHQYWDQGTRINTQLRAGEMPEIAVKVNSAISKSSLPEQTTAWRGMSVPDEQLSQLVPGGQLTNPGFTSTSKNAEYALRYADGPGRRVLVEYDLPKGAKALPFQEEIILAANQPQTITARSIVNTPQGPVVHLKVSLPPEETWMAARQRFGDDVAGWQSYVDETKKVLGLQLGEIRKTLASKTQGPNPRVPAKSDVRVDAFDFKNKLRKAIGPLPTERSEKQLSAVLTMVDEATDAGSLGADKLRQIIKNLEEGKAWRLRSAAVDVEKRLVAEHLPEQNEQYKRLLNQWADANELSRGAEKQYQAVNKGQEPIRFDRPAPIEPERITPPQLSPQAKPRLEKARRISPNIPPKPEFTGGPEARAEAEALLKPQFSTGQEILRSIMRAASGAVGAGVGQGSGIPYAGYAGAATGYQTGQSLADRWIKAARPTIGGIVKESEAANRTLQRWAPQLDAAMRRGPRAVRMLHKALLSADPDYREMVQESGRSAPPPLEFGEFTSSWRRRQ